MGRNLIVCCDGTDNQFGTNNTNVVRLIQTLERDTSRQRVYYDPGVGTLPEPGFVSGIGKRLSESLGLAFGSGLVRKIGLAYAFLMQLWQPDDRVFMFGFSRGAYTVRALAALLHMYGLLEAGDENLLPYVLRMFKTSPGELGKQTASARNFWALTDEFRETFAQAVPSRFDRRFPTHFMGVWDTVSSVGWLWDPQTFPFTRRNPDIRTIRHAVSLDERRGFFRQNLFQKAEGAYPPQDLLELWFPGVHSDVGGGYPESEGGLWREPYAWILEEAKKSGLRTDSLREERVWKRSQVPEKSWCEPAHESLTWKWRPLEFFPKLDYRGPARGRRPRMNLFRPRRIHADAMLHFSVRNRLRDLAPKYQPRALRGIDPSTLVVWEPPVVAFGDLLESTRAARVPDSRDIPELEPFSPPPRAASAPEGAAAASAPPIPEESGGEAADPEEEAADSQEMDSEEMDSEEMDSEEMDSEEMDSEEMDSEEMDSEEMDSDGATGRRQDRGGVSRSGGVQGGGEDDEEGDDEETDREGRVPPVPRYLQAQIRTGGPPGTRTRVAPPVQRAQDYIVAVRVGVQSAEYADPGTPAPIPPFVQDQPHRFHVYFYDLQSDRVRLDTIWLPPRGNSTECEFGFTAPAEGSEFRARIVLCHLGRILQAAVLRIPVGVLQTGDWRLLTLDVAAPLRGSDEATASTFDVALMLDQLPNQDLGGLLSTYRLPADGAPGTVVKLRQETLNNIISGIAATVRKHINSQPGKLDLTSAEVEKFFRKMAIHGSTLHDEVIRPSKLPTKRPPGWRLSIACSSDSFFPAEFVYDREVPADNARLCTSFWRSLSVGTCCGECDLRGGEVICPLGFWGLSCVIERKCGSAAGLEPPSPGEFELMYRAATLEEGLRMGQPALLATSEVVNKVDANVSSELRSDLRTIHHGQSESVEDWQHWVQAVAQLNPDVLVLVPHHVRDEFSLEYLQIGAESRGDFESHPNYLNSRKVTKGHVLGSIDHASPPLVLLLGCETSLARVAYENFVIAFERAGAACVAGTTAPIIGRHAAPAVRLLMSALHDKKAAGRRLGDVILDAKRKIMLEGYPMIMCLATYGGADHVVQHTSGAQASTTPQRVAPLLDR